jgi:hypothetical protein
MWACSSRILIFTHPGARIQKQQHKRGMKKISCHTVFWSHKFQKICNYFIFEMPKKKIWANELVTQKIVTKLSKKWVWDPEKTYSESRVPDPQH